MTKDEEMIKNIIINAYITVMGVDKWNSLTDKQKENVLHYVLKGFWMEVELIERGLL